MEPDAGFLLDESVFSVRLAGSGAQGLSLPGVLAALSGGEVDSFDALRPHQRHSWFAFLVQLAALALDGTDAPLPTDAPEWRSLLLALTEGHSTSWTLVVADLGEPAFMQPPVPENDLEALKNRYDTPDEIDILLTAKNHDVKGSRISASREEHWVYALVALQTMQGVLGAGNYGISRMNGGYGSRPYMSLVPNDSWSDRFRADVERLRAAVVNTRTEFGFSTRGGLRLLWLLPWDGKCSLALEECHPWFVEICRRVRLARHAGNLFVKGAATQAPRLNAKERRGVTGDPWTPVKRVESAALTVRAEGFNYRLLQRTLFEDEYVRPLSMEAPRGAEASLIAVTLVRGKGRTEGLHERVLPIPPTARPMLGRRGDAGTLTARSRGQVGDAATVEQYILRPALRILLAGGEAQSGLRGDGGDAWVHALDLQIDTIFFDRLWTHMHDGKSEAEAQALWRAELLDLARNELEDAMHSSAIPSARRLRAMCAAERMFAGCARKRFPDADLRRRWNGDAKSVGTSS